MRALELPGIGPAESRIGSGELRVDVDRRLERRLRLLQPAQIARLAQGAETGQVRVDGARIELMLLALAASQIRVLEDDLQRIRHRDGDVVLQFQDVAPRGIEIAGPHVIAGRRVDQLHRHPHVGTIATHAAFEHVPHAQRLADLADVEVPALELEGGCASCHAQSRYLRELGREFLAQSVAQVGVSSARAHVNQGQHGDRAGPGFQRGDGLGARGRGDVERAPPGEARHRRHQRNARDDDRPDGLARTRQPAHDARAIDPCVEHDALRRDLVRPRQHQDDRQPDHRQDGQGRHPPIREPQRLRT